MVGILHLHVKLVARNFIKKSVDGLLSKPLLQMDITEILLVMVFCRTHGNFTGKIIVAIIKGTLH